MKIRFRVAFSAYILGPSPEVLELSTTFAHPPFKVEISITGERALSSDDLPEEERHFRRATQILFELDFLPSDPRSTKEWNKLLNPARRLPLIRVLASIVNRVMRAIRNYGIVVHVAEIRFDEDEVDSLLHEWNVEVSHNGNKWQPVLKPKSGFWESLMAISIRRQPVANFRAARWPDIEEAIQDDLEPGPEREFLTNSLEHIRLRNFRLAVLEAIVCLEIVLSQFLENHLLINKRFSKNRLDKVLSKDVGLTTRVGLLLDLVLTPADLKPLNIGNVLKAISWRNTVVHKTGHLPRALSDDETKDCIFSVLHLAEILAAKRAQIVASPESKELARFIALAFKVPIPTISLVQNHRRVVHFQFFLSDEFPSEETMREITDVLARKIQDRDKRFVREEHLHVRFAEFQQTIAAWSKGELEVFAKPIARKPPPPPPDPLEPPPKE